MKRETNVVADVLELARASYGVVNRRALADSGVDRHAMRPHVRGGRWIVLGPNTLRVAAAEWCPVRSPIVVAVWESRAAAWADGASALVLAGLTGWRPDVVDVSTPRGARPRSLPGVRHHHVSVRPRILPAPAARADPNLAALRAAAWARSDRAASTLLSMAVQQRLAHPAHLAEALTLLPRLRRRALVAGVLGDLEAGSESIGELDFVAECRKRSLPLPERQVVVKAPSGHYRLDARWEAARLTVEIDGAHHYVGEVPMADALRQNDITITGETVLRIPRLALRVDPDPYFAQIRRALQARGILAA